MSTAYFCHKNFNWPQMVNMLCYSTIHPHTLTKTQKVTRLYRAVVRKHMNNHLFSNNYHMENMLRLHQKSRADFEIMATLDQDTDEFKTLIEKYEDMIEKTYDPSMLIDDSRPYAPTQGRYVVFDQSAVEHDPFGYYSPRLLSEKRPSNFMPYYMDYPVADSQWVLNDDFTQEDKKQE